MKVNEPTQETTRWVAERMRAKDIEEFLAVSFASDPQQLAEMLVERYADHPHGFCFHDDREPVAVGAMVEARPNVITLMFFATDRFADLALPIARFTTRILFPKYQAAGVHRIEAIAIDGYEHAHRWIELLGLKREGGPMRGFGKGGETFHQFAWVADDVR